MTFVSAKTSAKTPKSPKFLPFFSFFAIFLVFFALFTSITPVFATDSTDSSTESTHFSYTIESYFSYTIENYRIDMTVEEDKTYHITEKIDVFFHEPSHGIFRTIPLERQITPDPKAKPNCSDHPCLSGPVFTSFLNTEYAETSHISSNHHSTIETVDKTVKTTQIKLGDENKTLTGAHSYTIKYDFKTRSLTPDHNSNFYFNLIGLDWDTTIRHVDFNITLPKPFDPSKLGFSSGNFGSTGYNPNHLKYTVKDNVITGSYSDVLLPRQALTVRLSLPPNYFNYNYNLSFRLNLFLALIFTTIVLLVFIYFKLLKNPKHVVETVEFYPPENFNSLDTALAYYGRLSNKHILSLLIYLADQGYLKIIDLSPQNPQKSFRLFKKPPNFKIIRLKKYDGTNPEEKLFMGGLFSRSRTDKDGNLYTTKSLLSLNFYNTINRISTSIHSSDKFSQIFATKQVIFARFFIISLLTIAAFFSYFIFFINLRSVGDTLLFSLCSALPITALATLTTFKLNKRTSYGVKLLGKIRGFRKFLATAEKPDLESLVESDPTYFYKILPYTYALGLSDKWVKKFESIAVEPVEWYSYSGSNLTNTIALNNFINTNLTSSLSSFTSAPSYSGGSSGSGSSGGSSSGGGSGGGGGGSW